MKRNIKLISVILVLVLALGLVLAGCGKKQAEDPKNAVFVTLSNACELGTDKHGSYVAAVAVEIPEAGSTIKEVIKSLHKTYAKGGEGDFVTSTGQYGEQIDKLWGVENGGNYMYYLNNAMAMGLDDPVKVGDTIDLIIMKDTTTWSDAYIVLTAEASGTEVTAKAEAMGFDASFNTVMNPLKGTKLYYVDGNKLVDTKAVTGEDGTAKFTLKAGTYRIVALNTDATYSAAAVKLVIAK